MFIQSQLGTRRFWPCSTFIPACLSASLPSAPPFQSPFKKCREEPTCRSRTSDGAERTWHLKKTTIVLGDTGLCCPRITWWPLVSSILPWSYQTTFTKEPIRPEFHFVVKKGLVLSERSLFRFYFSIKGGGGTQVHCSSRRWKLELLRQQL